MQFIERSPIEVGFAEVFETQIAPQLLVLEKSRQEKLRHGRIMRAIVVVVTLIVLVLIVRFASDDTVFVLLCFTPFIGFAAYVFVGSKAEIWWETTMKDIAMPAILSHAGGLEQAEDARTFPLEKVRELGLIFNYNNKIMRHLLRGSHKSVGFQMVHARLSTSDSSQKVSLNNSSMFIGFMFQIDLPNPAPGRISLMRERGTMGNKLAETLASGFGTRSWPKVTFDHNAFEARFEVYAEVPDAAKAYFTTRMLDGLVDIGDEDGMRPRNFMIGYDGPSFYMTLPRDGLEVMPIGKLNTPVTDIQEQIHDIFDDIAVAHKVIDRLLLT